MSDLTEFDHAVNAVFGAQQRVTDPAQGAWLDTTAYWTVWWGIVCDMDVVVSDDFKDEWYESDEHSCCVPYWEIPSNEIGQSTVEAGEALWLDGTVVEWQLDSEDRPTTWPRLHMRRWEMLGRMWQNDANFVPDRKYRHKVRCE